MSLGDILVEILGEMMGVPIKKKRPPTQSRPVAPPPVASSPFSHEEDDDVYMYDDEEGEDRYESVYREVEPDPEPEAPVVFHPPLPAPSAIMAAVEHYETLTPPVQTIQVKQEARRSVTKVKPAGLPDGFVESIRTDNAAARAAIVSAEIFGPPVSERRDRQW
jgi:hypothetical protein